MTLALFDLDNTLLAGDSDYLWGQFLIQRGLVDAQSHAEKNDAFYQQYLEGTMDIYAFLHFQLHPLTQHPMETLHTLRAEFLQQMIEPIILPAARSLVEKHRQLGHIPLIITATNRFITEPIAGLFGVEHLLATEPEIVDGRYSGGVSGTPCYQAGKVARLNQWLQSHRQNLNQSWFYSDSHNDLPLLERVQHPVAVDPDPDLLNIAQQRGWQITSLRTPTEDPSGTPA